VVCIGNIVGICSVTAYEIYTRKYIGYVGRLEGVWSITKHGFTLKMEAVHSSEISEQTKHSAQC
jgi:hypothetical protein